LDEPKGRLGKLPLDGGALLYSLSYQMHKQEHGLETAAERRAADARG